MNNGIKIVHAHVTFNIEIKRNLNLVDLILVCNLPIQMRGIS